MGLMYTQNKWERGGRTKQWESYGMIHKLQFGTFYVNRCIMATIEFTVGCVYLGYCLGEWQRGQREQNHRRGVEERSVLLWGRSDHGF